MKSFILFIVISGLLGTVFYLLVLSKQPVFTSATAILIVGGIAGSIIQLSVDALFKHYSTRGWLTFIFYAAGMGIYVLTALLLVVIIK